MITIKEIFDEISALSLKLKALQPLKPEDQQRLWQKFLLEWNFNSNHIEGNTLTYGHTELLLRFDKVVADYSGREIEEMKAHDVAIKMIVELSKDKERDLSESFIRELNDLILVRPFWKEAFTADGQSTMREIIPGSYKKFMNSVRQENGHMFNYSLPEETPALMNDLMEFYKVHSKSSETHPVWLAAIFHYKFVLIHPFDDGNGRVARLLMNFILLKNDLPPVIIKSDDKKGYLTALNKADVGDLEAFVNYIGTQLIWSLNKSIEAAKGNTIEDFSDIDKELMNLKTKLKGESILKASSNSLNITEAIRQNVIPICILLEEKCKELSDFFFEFIRDITFQSDQEFRFTINQSWDSIIKWLDEDIKNNEKRINQVKCNFELRGFKNTIKASQFWFYIEAGFYNYNYQISSSNNHNAAIKIPYDKSLSQQEIHEFIIPIIRHLIHNIEEENKNIISKT
jgi:Fic family protein